MLCKKVVQESDCPFSFSRITLQPNSGNGLKKPSQVMMDKIMTVKRDKVGPAFGHIDADALVQIERCLALFLGIAK